MSAERSVASCGASGRGPLSGTGRERPFEVGEETVVAEFVVLLEAGRRVAETLDLPTILQAAVDGITGLAGLDTAAVYLLDGDMLHLWATYPPLPPGFPDQLRNAPLVGASAHPGLDPHGGPRVRGGPSSGREDGGRAGSRRAAGPAHGALRPDARRRGRHRGLHRRFDGRGRRDLRDPHRAGAGAGQPVRPDRQERDAVPERRDAFGGAAAGPR